MSDQPNAAVTMLRKQLQELDAIEKEAVTQSMNTVGATELVHKWKARTVALIAQQISPQAAQPLAGAKPGPSFTNDLFEEFSDEVELYRLAVRAVMKDLPAAGPTSGPA
ncbi:MAG TPA: hypothetical protein VGA17_10465 [Nitrospiraceae bacterium]